MKTYHATAIALVSWYLVAPPVRWSTREPAYLDTHAEYRDWNVLHEFKSADDCEAGEQRAELDAANGIITAFDGGFIKVIQGDPQPLLDQRAEGECMADDDPRIEGIKKK